MVWNEGVNIIPMQEEEIKNLVLTCVDCDEQGDELDGIMYSTMHDDILCDRCFNKRPVPQDVIDEAIEITKKAVDEWKRGVYTDIDEKIKRRATRDPEKYQGY